MAKTKGLLDSKKGDNEFSNAGQSQVVENK